MGVAVLSTSALTGVLELLLGFLLRERRRRLFEPSVLTGSFLASSRASSSCRTSGSADLRPVRGAALRESALRAGRD